MMTETTDRPANRPPEVSVIVLAFNSAGHLRPCLVALAQTVGVEFETVVVDNASRDDSAGLAAQLLAELGLRGKVLPLQQNLGCAGGNNAGWRASRGEYLLFLNPDTEVSPILVKELIDPLRKDTTIGITGAKMYFPGGRVLQHAGGILHPNGMTDHWGHGQVDVGQHDAVAEMDYVTGAGVAISRELIERVGGFDESYFPAYYEEVDLCYRVRKLGLKVLYIPTATMVHHESVSLGSNSPALRRLYPRMRIRFVLKNFSVRQLVRYALPFEVRWMLREPGARGYRRQQFAAYFANLPLLVRKVLGMNRRR